jgi:hypothetical protein
MMISRAESKLGSQSFMQLVAEPRGELSTLVQNNPLRNSMKTNNPRYIKICQLIPSVGGLYWYKVGDFGESMHNNPDSIVTTVRLGKSRDEVHPYFILFPLGYLKRLQQSSGVLVFSLHMLTDITPGDKQGNFTLHSMPQKSLLQVLVHFGSSGMDRIRLGENRCGHQTERAASSASPRIVMVPSRPGILTMLYAWCIFAATGAHRP